jgi:hypothetical protein
MCRVIQGMAQHRSFCGFIDSVLQIRLAPTLVEQGFDPAGFHCRFVAVKRIPR